jgi:hypothetical protein
MEVVSCAHQRERSGVTVSFQFTPPDGVVLGSKALEVYLVQRREQVSHRIVLGSAWGEDIVFGKERTQLPFSHQWHDLLPFNPGQDL